jgi:ubiquinone biosynthesis protein UbiJ
MQSAITQVARRVRSRVAGRSANASVQDQLAQRVRRLEKRVEELEREHAGRIRDLADGLQEQRRLSPRVASLSDFVAEVVSATVRGDRAELDAALAKYADGL